MEAFLFKADKNILDISYSIDEKKIIIQVVLLTGGSLSQERVENIKYVLDGDLYPTAQSRN